MNYTREDLFNILEQYESEHGGLPSRDGTRGTIIPETPFKTIFGGYAKGKLEYEIWKRNKTDNVIDNRDTLIEQLKKNLSEDELRLLVKSSSTENPANRKFQAPIEKECFKFIATGDSHIGHSKFRDDWWNYMIEVGVRENVDWMYHTGDILEGMSGRPGHVYELENIGFEAQFNHAKQLMKDIPFKIKGIEGNHDGWNTIKGDIGLSVGARLEESLDNFIYMGHQEADDVVGGIKIKLWHGNDGASYAYSYRTQKFVEMLSGGEKPNILLAGHAHKSIFYETRNVHVFETGTLCSQTSFMRGKKLAAHIGFWVVTCYTDGHSLIRIVPEWYPFYL